MRNGLATALAVAALSTAWTARAQCTGYLVPREARLWTEGDKDEPRLGDRDDHVPAVVSRSINPGLGVKLEKGLHLNWLGGCRPEDGVHDRKTKRIRIVLLDSTTENFEKAWALPSELVPFKYEYPGSDQDGPENLAAIRKAAGLAVAEITSKDFKRPVVENQRVFRNSFDAIWRALVETVSARKWQVDRIDRASGLLTTKATEPNGGATMACATKYEGPATVLTNIVVGKAAGGQSVTVNTTFVVTRGHDVVACYTNGALEKELFGEIGKRLAAPGATK